MTTAEQSFNALLDVPMEQWKTKGVKLTACSANSDGKVNSFFAVMRGHRYYGYRKHEFKNGQFTGKEWFEVEKRI